MKNKRLLLLEQILLPNARDSFNNLPENHPDRQYWANRVDEYELEVREHKEKDAVRVGYHTWRLAR